MRAFIFLTLVVAQVASDDSSEEVIPAEHKSIKTEEDPQPTTYGISAHLPGISIVGGLQCSKICRDEFGRRVCCKQTPGINIVAGPHPHPVPPSHVVPHPVLPDHGPTHPVHPTHPDQPIHPVHPAHPVHPTHPGQPIYPVHPAYPGSYLPDCHACGSTYNLYGPYGTYYQRQCTSSYHCRSGEICCRDRCSHRTVCRPHPYDHHHYP
ncbi:uncharacterized protein LOC143018778 [Oratosquilla oratoria]|uniref:uncharacterized protein LOC143018778 n=1 Tax=Oratosquilla oratoria TaxID=337810 RepID=UPI003F76B9EA